jgi:hypothetical protein
MTLYLFCFVSNNPKKINCVLLSVKNLANHTPHPPLYISLRALNLQHSCPDPPFYSIMGVDTTISIYYALDVLSVNALLWFPLILYFQSILTLSSDRKLTKQLICPINPN